MSLPLIAFTRCTTSPLARSALYSARLHAERARAAATILIRRVICRTSLEPNARRVNRSAAAAGGVFTAAPRGTAALVGESALRSVGVTALRDQSRGEIEDALESFRGDRVRRRRGLRGLRQRRRR